MVNAGNWPLPPSQTPDPSIIFLSSNRKSSWPDQILPFHLRSSLSIPAIIPHSPLKEFVPHYFLTQGKCANL